MLGKLWKHELKNTSKVMFTVYLILAAVTVCGMAVLFFRNKNGNGMAASVIFVILAALYLFTIFSLFIFVCIYMAVWFYKTMYSSEGYLTHTLPVSTMANFHTKLLVSLIWMLLTIFLCIVSVFGIAGAAAGQDFWKVFTDFNQTELQNVWGMSLGQSAVILLLSVIMTCLYFLLYIYASCSIGQLFHQSKIAASVIAGIALYFLQQIVSAIAVFVLLFSNYRQLEDLEAGSRIFRMSIWSAFGICLFLSAAYYLVCRVILKKRLNLD